MATKPFLLLLICASIVGCQLSPEQELVGAWTTNRKQTHLPAFLQGGRKSVANGIYATQLKLSSDHTFVLAGFRQFGGKWSYLKGILTLTPAIDSSDGRWKLANEIREFHVDSDFSRMKITIPSPQGEIVIVLDKTA